MLIKILILLIGILHIYFFILESYLYTKEKGRKVFQLTDEKIKFTKLWAYNQGYYNLCLGIGLLLALFLNNKQMILYLLLFVSIAGIVGGISFSKRIFYIQGIPAIVAVIAYCFLN